MKKLMIALLSMFMMIGSSSIVNAMDNDDPVELLLEQEAERSGANEYIRIRDIARYSASEELSEFAKNLDDELLQLALAEKEIDYLDAIKKLNLKIAELDPGLL